MARHIGINFAEDLATGRIRRADHCDCGFKKVRYRGAFAHEFGIHTHPKIFSHFPLAFFKVGTTRDSAVPASTVLRNTLRWKVSFFGGLRQLPGILVHYVPSLVSLEAAAVGTQVPNPRHPAPRRACVRCGGPQHWR